MPTPTPADLLAQAILTKEKRKAHAKAILNRTASTSPVLIAGLIVSPLATYLVTLDRFDAPLSVKVLLAAAFIAAVLNMVDAWITRRRLDAAITLLQLDQE